MLFLKTRLGEPAPSGFLKSTEHEANQDGTRKSGEWLESGESKLTVGEYRVNGNEGDENNERDSNRDSIPDR
jgi:hypothetical protein